jgi:hypothetical protein
MEAVHERLHDLERRPEGGGARERFGLAGVEPDRLLAQDVLASTAGSARRAS